MKRRDFLVYTASSAGVLLPAVLQHRQSCLLPATNLAPRRTPISLKTIFQV
jgi:hypothetical protein